MQKIFEYIGLISLMIFSFFITERTTTIAKNMDNIMLEINKNHMNKEIKSQDAIIDGNKIKPGICSKKVNINKSYNEMKKVGIYDENLYQFDYKLPNRNILNNTNKYVISGNEYKNYVYLFINLNRDNKNLIENYSFNNYNFIINYSFYMDNIKLVNKLIKNNNSILISNTSFKNYKKISKNYYESINKKIYCFNDKLDNEFLNMCSGNKSNTIYIEYNNIYDLSKIKSMIKRGNFVYIDLNKYSADNIFLLEKFIEQKGITKGNIDDNLSEC